MARAGRAATAAAAALLSALPPARAPQPSAAPTAAPAQGNEVTWPPHITWGQQQDWEIAPVYHEGRVTKTPSPEPPPSMPKKTIAFICLGVGICLCACCVFFGEHWMKKKLGLADSVSLDHSIGMDSTIESGTGKGSYQMQHSLRSMRNATIPQDAWKWASGLDVSKKGTTPSSALDTSSTVKRQPSKAARRSEDGNAPFSALSVALPSDPSRTMSDPLAVEIPSGSFSTSSMARNPTQAADGSRVRTGNVAVERADNTNTVSNPGRSVRAGTARKAGAPITPRKKCDPETPRSGDPRATTRSGDPRSTLSLQLPFGSGLAGDADSGLSGGVASSRPSPSASPMSASSRGSRSPGHGVHSHPGSRAGTHADQPGSSAEAQASVLEKTLERTLHNQPRPRTGTQVSFPGAEMQASVLEKTLQGQHRPRTGTQVSFPGAEMQASVLEKTLQSQHRPRTGTQVSFPGSRTGTQTSNPGSRTGTGAQGTQPEQTKRAAVAAVPPDVRARSKTALSKTTAGGAVALPSTSPTRGRPRGATKAILSQLQGGGLVQAGVARPAARATPATTGRRGSDAALAPPAATAPGPHRPPREIVDI